ncbi:DUF317 domain-containing protein [Streptomyces sp. NBC_01335]|uniref:DUF317 domain-containing protein n=1 Tax=Streptomyces sp. NBC_01335 TaxID=2903828 RepID=UPI002E127D42|nr:DUF317 domain-containing protein [Streptomyces sp. NBC_01335]
MNSSTAALLPAVRTTVQDRDWLSTDHCADAVLGLLDNLGWSIVDTSEANVHATSPDSRVYVGWLPEDRGAWSRNIVWHVRVQPSDAEPWVQEFGLFTPSEAVAGFIAALVAQPAR